MTRKEFIFGASSLGAGMTLGGQDSPDVLDLWQQETDLIKPKTYRDYLKDGDTRDFASLKKLEAGFARVLAEIDSCQVGEIPAVWLIYNMGYIVKTRESLFSIDLNHRRDLELAPKLDFALITHNHDDHYREPFYRAMDRAGKTVVTNFLDGLC